MARGLLVAGVILVGATCRLSDLIGTPKGAIIDIRPVAPNALVDSAPKGSTALREDTISVTNIGGGELRWTATTKLRSSWLLLPVDSGTAPTPLRVQFDPAGLDNGLYYDTVVVQATTGGGSGEVPVRLEIHPCRLTPISLPGSISDTLTTADCGAPHRSGSYARLFNFTGVENDLVTIEVAAGYAAYVALDTALASTALPFAETGECFGVSGSPCLYYQQLPRSGTHYIEVTSANPDDSGSFTLRLLQPRDPNPPDSLDQRLGDSTTSVSQGDTIKQTSLLLRAVISDPDLGDSLSLQAEVQPNNIPLTGPPTATGTVVVANGQPAWVAVTGLNDNTSYHWRVRALDQTNLPGEWRVFGGDPDFRVAVPHPPFSPTGLVQSKPDGTPIQINTVADTDFVVFSATVNDQDPGDLLRLQAEVLPIGIDFTNSPTDSGAAVSSGPAQVEVGQLGNNVSYHWQVRVSDQTGRTSAWVPFGGNPEPNGVDFRVQVPNLPLEPTALNQFQSDGTTPISEGGVTQASFVVLKGIVSDPDVGQQVQLEVEVLPITQPNFTNTANFPPGALVANGATASVTVGPLSNQTDYHWQARARDATGRPGAWVSFPSPPAAGNLETEADFRVQQPPTQLVFTGQPPATTVAGVAMTPAIQVTARDINGNTSTGFTGNVTMTIDQGPVGGTLGGTTVVAANAGVASFGNLIITKAGTYVLRATTSAPSLTQTSGAFNIVPAATSQLVFTTQPSNAQAAVAITPPIVVAAQDAFFNTTSFGGQVTLTIAANPGSPPGTLTGGGPVTAVNGVAQFSGVSINKTGVGYTLRAGSGTLTPDTSQTFNITPGPATNLIFTVPPSNAAANAVITPPVRVTALDANDNVATGFVSNITVAIGTNPPGNGILGGTLTVPATAGVSQFSNLSIDKIGTGYTLTAAASGLTGTTSSAFNIVNSPISPTLSTVAAGPNVITASAGTSQSTITVTARDGANNPVQGASATISVTGTGNTVLPAGPVITNALGVATWTLSSTVATELPATELKIISAVISSISITQRDTVTVNPGPADTLVFTTQPGATTAGVAINSGSGGVVVTARDQFENRATGFSSTLTMVLGANPAGGVLSGTLTATPAAGVATFPNLRIIKAGTGYQLRASGGALTSPLSNAFTINPAPPNQLVFTTQPTNTAVLARIDSAVGGVVVTVQDSVGNTTPSFAGQVRIILGTTAGGTLTGGGFISTNQGVATFPNLTLNVLGTYSLVTTSTGPSLSSDESVLFDIIPGPAKTLNFTVQPTQTVAGQVITPAVQVTARDIQGNTATGFTGNVTVAIGTNGGTPPGTLSGTQTQPATGGIANFPNLSINNAGPGYTLTASTPALPSGPVTGATSNPFNIISGGVSATLSTITRSPMSIPASGGTITSTISVTARDNLGNPIQGLTVVLAATPVAGNTLTQPVGTTNASGVATGTLASTVAETKTVAATIDGTLINATTTVVVNPAAPKLLLFNVQPNNTVATQTIRPATGVQVEVRDTFNNRVTTASNTVNIAILNNAGTPVPGTLSGTTPRTPVGGVVTFNDLSIDKVGPGYTLLTSSTGLVSDASGPFNINFGAATKLGFVQQPTTTSGGAPIPTITVEVQDAGGNRVGTATNAIGLAILNNPSGGTLSGDNNNNAVSGLATFSGLSIDNAGTNYTLQATATNLTAVTSSAFDITVGGAAKLGFVQQPTTTTGGATLAPVTVEIQDAGGNRVLGATNSVALAIGTNPGPNAVLTGGSAVPAVNGLATFSGLSIDSAGTGYTLVATSVSLTQATSSAFDITVGSATKLGFRVQPSNTAGGASITPAIEVEVRDAGGNRVTSGGPRTIDIAILNNAGGGTLSGDVSNNSSSGVATFGDLSINNAGSGYTLQATSTGLTSAASAAFNITVGAATKLRFVQQPTQASGGATIAPAVTVEILDAGDNRVNSTANVTLAIGTNPGPSAVLTGGGPVAAVAGLAAFSGLSIDSAGTGYTLVATSGALTQATSNTFNIVVGTAAKLGFRVQPSNTAGGASITPAIEVEVRDAGGNRVTGAGNSITLAIGVNQGPGAVLTGANPVSATSGLATFSGMSIDSAGTGYTLVATAGGLTQATSVSFNITVGAAAKLAFRVQPSNTVAGVSIAAIQIEVQDAGGNRVTSPNQSVTLAILNNPGNPPGNLSGNPNPRNSASGLVNFDNVSIDKAGSGYTLQATAAGLSNTTSVGFNITHAGADHLAFTVQPSTTQVDQPIMPDVVVQVRDAFDNLVTNASNAVTLVMSTDPSGGAATLSNGGPISASGGVATFSNLSINAIASGYRLDATASGLTAATSDLFDIN